MDKAARGWAWAGVVWILVGCFFNNVVLEYIIHYDKGAGGLMTLFQFIFVALSGLPAHLQLAPTVRLHHKAPLSAYFRMTLLFFLISFANNKAFAWGISQPFNVVFRSSSLLISFLVGYFGFHQRYTLRQFASVLLVTVGVVLTTSAELLVRVGAISAPSDSSRPEEASPRASLTLMLTSLQQSCCDAVSVWAAVSAAVDSAGAVGSWAIGTALLGSTLLGLAVLGHMQNDTYRCVDFHRCGQL